jgi:hypothetical protein
MVVSMSLLVPRLCLGMLIQRLCLFFVRISEAEPLDLGSQAEPGNQLSGVGTGHYPYKFASMLR